MHLVDGCEPFLSLDAVLKLVLFPLFVPDLLLLIVLSKVVGPDLMVQDPHDAASPVLDGQTNVYAGLPSLGVMSHTGRSHFVPLEAQDQLVLDLQLFQVLHEVLLGLFLGQDLSFCGQVLRFRLVVLEETLQDVLGDHHVLIIWLLELLQVLEG
eukprot:CAMPEP_0170567566 /NCGR_PEP_ID=MMETSP0211-20121228/80560_1 /TAXON_ID=311385 /ORGANISM="Pseudokeronopsis sp., Strain OXSARD2" /LENGTH=153 /DNA_ID=CAMNT_0010889057 /DNA_START=434 /DNA_END=895 /DNA_ORIENTATION=+